MKIKILFVLLFLCTACTEKSISEQETHKILSQFIWSWTPPNSQTPIQLSFDQPAIGMDSQCNIFGSRYSLKENKMSIDQPIVSSAIGCPPDLEKQEAFIKSFFEPPVPFQIKYASSKHPQLIFRKEKIEYVFIGTRLSKIANKN